MYMLKQALSRRHQSPGSTTDSNNVSERVFFSRSKLLPFLFCFEVSNSIRPDNGQRSTESCADNSQQTTVNGRPSGVLLLTMTTESCADNGQRSTDNGGDYACQRSTVNGQRKATLTTVNRQQSTDGHPE